MTGAWRSGVLAVALAAGSCGDDERPACQPGEVIACPCPFAEVGQQTCLADGSGFGSCQPCNGGEGGAGGDGAAGGAGGAGGMGGSEGGQGGAVQGCEARSCDACIESACATEACAPEIAACEANDACAAFERCLAGCTSERCAVGCSAEHVDGVGDSSAKNQCLLCRPDTCRAQCDPDMTSC